MSEMIALKNKINERHAHGRLSVRLRKPRPTRSMVCCDGPMRGEVLAFGDYSRTSAIFTYRGQTGRYIGGNWVAA